MREDRSAGRWCAECQQHGSHHTDKHAEFTGGLLTLEGVLAAHGYLDSMGCNCGRADLYDYKAHAAHQADAVRAWLLGQREVVGRAAVKAISDRDPATCDHRDSARSEDGIWCAWCDGHASVVTVLAALTTQAREGETKEASDG